MHNDLIQCYFVLIFFIDVRTVTTDVSVSCANSVVAFISFSKIQRFTRYEYFTKAHIEPMFFRRSSKKPYLSSEISIGIDKGQVAGLNLTHLHQIALNAEREGLADQAVEILRAMTLSLQGQCANQTGAAVAFRDLGRLLHLRRAADPFAAQESPAAYRKAMALRPDWVAGACRLALGSEADKCLASFADPAAVTRPRTRADAAHVADALSAAGYTAAGLQRRFRVGGPPTIAPFYVTAALTRQIVEARARTGHGQCRGRCRRLALADAAHSPAPRTCRRLAQPVASYSFSWKASR